MCSFRNAYLVQSTGSGSVGGEDVIKCQISPNHLLKLINLAEIFTENSVFISGVCVCVWGGGGGGGGGGLASPHGVNVKYITMFPV